MLLEPFVCFANNDNQFGRYGMGMISLYIILKFNFVQRNTTRACGMHYLNITLHTHNATISFHLSGRVTEEIEKQNGHMGGVAWTATFSKNRKKKV